MNSASLTAGGPRSMFHPVFNHQTLDEDYVQGAFDLQPGVVSGILYSFLSLLWVMDSIGVGSSC